MSTARLRLRQEEPLRDPVLKVLTRGLLRVQVMLTLTPAHLPVKPSPTTSSSAKTAPPDRPPTRAHAGWRQTTTGCSTKEALNTSSAPGGPPTPGTPGSNHASPPARDFLIWRGLTKEAHPSPARPIDGSGLAKRLPTARQNMHRCPDGEPTSDSLLRQCYCW